MAAIMALPRNHRTILNQHDATVMQRGAKTSYQPSSPPSMRRAFLPAQDSRPVILRYEKHQDIIPVNSVEEEEDREPRHQGLQHYLHMLEQLGLDTAPSVDRIDTHDPHSFQPTITFSEPPRQALSTPSAPTTYTSRIYTGKTHNPKILFAILHIAQSNHPTLNLASATTHIPNLLPTDTLPVLHPTAPGNLAPHPFLDNTSPPKRPSDTDITIAFLPRLYSPQTHGLGYFQILTSARGVRTVGACMFTPCTEAELRRWGLVAYIDGREGEGVEGMERVGCLRGGWVERDTVEEYEEWKLVWRVVGRVWEGRLGFARGELEG